MLIDKRLAQIAAVMVLMGVVLFASRRLWAHQIIIDDIRITEESGCSEILVIFSIPVRYVKHFPYEFGDDLRIKIQPIASTNPIFPDRGKVTATGQEERDALFTREPVLPPPNELAGLTKVVYEGDVPDGPFLTLFFERTVAYQIGQGDDYRSLVIMVTAPETPAPCRIPQK
ncbi:MAG: hypothetical protein ACE5GF_07660 [Thermodesulfobacteriota bacterium]